MHTLDARFATDVLQSFVEAGLSFAEVIAFIVRAREVAPKRWKPDRPLSP